MLVRTAATLALVLGATFASTLRAQGSRLSGRVTDEAGRPLAKAQVYANVVNVRVDTDQDGSYALAFADSLRGMSINVRVRALGHSPAVRPVRLLAGPQVMNFALQKDTTHPDSVRTIARAKAPPINAPTKTTAFNSTTKRPASATSKVPMRATTRSAAAAPDPFARHMFPPELVMRHQDEIALRESQRAALQSAIQEAQSQVTQLQWSLALASEKFSKSLEKAVLDEKEVLAQVDEVINAEREIKRVQMTLLVRIKNALSPEQQAKLRELR